MYRFLTRVNVKLINQWTWWWWRWWWRWRNSSNLRGLACFIWLRHYAIIEPTSRVINCPRDQMLHD